MIPKTSANKILALGVFITAASAALSMGRIDRFFQSYLLAFLFVAEYSIGSMALLMISNLTGGEWAVLARPSLRAATRSVYVLAILFLPLLWGAHLIYPWAITPLSGHQSHYLNVSAFAVRSVFYLLAWTALSQALLRLKNLQAVSAAGLIFLMLSGSFAAIDWQMSLEPHWYSTIYGLIFLIGQALGAWAFTLLIVRPTSPKTARDMGNILLALIMLWAYLDFMQYLIIWSGNLPSEVTWLNHRIQGGWQWVAITLISFQFFAPFASLLFRNMKEQRQRMLGLCGLIIAFRLLDHFWMVMPSLHGSPLDLAWTDISLVFGLGSIWLAAFFRGAHLE